MIVKAVKSAKTLGRTSKSTGLPIDNRGVVKRVARRISHATGLSLYDYPHDSEPLAIMNYGLGGWYGPHYDALGNGREATVMFWVRIVERVLTIELLSNE